MTINARFPVPKHIIVAGSAWISRLLVGLVQIVSIRILITSIGLDHYAAFSLILGLSGWFLLADMGMGPSLQNQIAERRAKGISYDNLVFAVALFALLLFLVLSAALYLLSPLLSSVYFRQFSFLSTSEKTQAFFWGGLILLGAALGSIVYKIWYAQQKGYLANVLPAVGAVLALLGLYVIRSSDVSDKFFWSVIVYLLPTAVLPFIALLGFLFRSGRRVRWSSSFGNAMEILASLAGKFWFFALMAAGVLQAEFVVMSQLLKPNQIAVYHIASKLFGLLFFVYNAVLAALWPVFTEEAVKHNWQFLWSATRKYITLGVLLVSSGTATIILAAPYIMPIIAPDAGVAMPFSLMLLFGLYFIIRVWTDTFAMILQSTSQLKPFWILVPLQALITFASQWALTPWLGYYGIVGGLIVSFLLTVSWGLPLAVVRYHQRTSIA